MITIDYSKLGARPKIKPPEKIPMKSENSLRKSLESKKSLTTSESLSEKICLKELQNSDIKDTVDEETIELIHLKSNRKSCHSSSDIDKKGHINRERDVEDCKDVDIDIEPAKEKDDINLKNEHHYNTPKLTPTRPNHSGNIWPEKFGSNGKVTNTFSNDFEKVFSPIRGGIKKGSVANLRSRFDNYRDEVVRGTAKEVKRLKNGGLKPITSAKKPKKIGRGRVAVIEKFDPKQSKISDFYRGSRGQGGRGGSPRVDRDDED